MADLNLQDGARAPLFDRFGGADGGAAAPFLPWHATRRDGLELSLSALEESIGAELDRLLNTRCGTPIEKLLGRERSVIDYGLPDYSALYGGSLDDSRLLTTLVKDTIVAFEPRLRQVHVELNWPGHSRHALQLAITGRVLLHGRLEPVQFQIAAHPEARSES